MCKATRSPDQPKGILIQTAVPYKPSHWLLEIDAVHPINCERYMPEERTFDYLRLKHALLGSSELVLISDAETLRIVHPYEHKFRALSLAEKTLRSQSQQNGSFRELRCGVGAPLQHGG